MVVRELTGDVFFGKPRGIEKLPVIFSIMLSIILAFIISLTIPTFSLATEVYKWIDENGITHFTDNPASIPENQRKNTRIRIFRDPAPSVNPENTVPDTFNNGRFSIAEDIKYRKLSWDDFKGEPDYNNIFSTAEILTKYTYQTKHSSKGNKNDAVNIKVIYEIDKYNSWVKPNGNSDYNLKHEQGHFDIGYIYAKELVNRIKKINLNIDTYKEEIKKVYDKVMSERNEINGRYENETNHAQNNSIQERWNKVIKEWVKKYL